MATVSSPLQQSKTKSKRRSKGPAESPGGAFKQSHQWIPLPTTQYLVPSHKLGAFQQIELAPPIPNAPGGMIEKEKDRSLLHALWIHTSRVDIDEYLPVRQDSICLHPETMRVCGYTIAAPLMVRAATNDVKESNDCYVYCKAWPLPSLQLDMVALGCDVALAVCGADGDDNGGRVKVCPLPSPTSSIPVARKLTLVSSKKLNFPLDTSFSNYFLHMHDGCLVSPYSVLSVQYLGEKQTFRITDLEPLSDDDQTHSHSTMELEQSLSKLSLNSSELDDDIPPPPPVSQQLIVHKVTGRTKLEFVSARGDDGDDVWGGSKERATSLEAVGGMGDKIKLLKEIVLRPLNSDCSGDGVMFPSGVLLYGPAGVGKSLLARALVTSSAAHTICVSAVQVLSKEAGNTLQRIFTEARENCPSLVVLDDVDMLCPHQNTSPSEMERQATAALSALLDDLHTRPPPSHMVVIATTNQLERVETSIRRPGRLDKEIEIPVPTVGGRKEILDILFHGKSHALTSEQMKCVSERAHGYVGADLHAVCLEAQYKALHRKLEGAEAEKSGAVVVTFGDVMSALREVRPSAMREVILEVPKVLWSDIGGQEEVKQRMKEAVEWPLKFPEAFERLGINPPRGVLLYGPPGCSKTMVARALATESGLNFMAVKGPELFSKWVGDSERALRQVFGRARAAAPAIIFFDEIDALAVQRKNEGSSVADRVLAQLLTEMDGIESLGDVLVVAATNRPDMIDKALLRPGRIDRLIYVPLPSELTRKEIFQIQFKKVPVEDQDVVVGRLVALTTSFSGAEVVSLCQKAALNAMHEDKKSNFVRWRHFEEALKNISPQTDEATIKFYQEFADK